ncbi:unnamed protein product [Euphydryas editha]|uniref:tRNA (guanine(37)-N1)-methyltransferase n=1 Tax=Euphydryas editha TaxID=104508 RepID=A0AAU9VC02_EUPED|nr:unnamed protein product [Euphydryas editha]
MSTSSKSLLIPIGVRGMRSLDREKFNRNITAPVLKVSGEKLSKITQICKTYFLKMENFKPVQNLVDQCNENLNKCIYFDPNKVTNWTDIPDNIRTSLKQYDIDEKNFDLFDLTLTYNNFKFDTIFKAVLPENEEIVSSFSHIGHIIHLNLRDHLLEYRWLIGQVLLDKIKNCRTVVNKTYVIDNTYRNFNMEVIAGDEDFIVTVKENKCNFQFDFSKVYWNPRLCKEHERILELLKPGDVLFDVFCGVGPFAIPAAKKNCRVFANDLNPESYKWLNLNAKQNKIKADIFRSFNMDGKEFIQKIFKCYILNVCNEKDKIDDGAKIHITMNLPAIAVEFLKYFRGLIKETDLKDKFNSEIIVHVYCFTVGENHTAIAKQLVNENFGTDVSPYILNVFNVRNVSPKKEMMRVSFKLTKEFIFDTNCISEETNEPPCKIQCTRKTEE